jgi:hypothetical protein
VQKHKQHNANYPRTESGKKWPGVSIVMETATGGEAKAICQIAILAG